MKCSLSLVLLVTLAFVVVAYAQQQNPGKHGSGKDVFDMIEDAKEDAEEEVEEEVEDSFEALEDSPRERRSLSESIGGEKNTHSQLERRVREAVIHVTTGLRRLAGGLKQAPMMFI